MLCVFEELGRLWKLMRKVVSSASWFCCCMRACLAWFDDLLLPVDRLCCDPNNGYALPHDDEQGWRENWHGPDARPRNRARRLGALLTERLADIHTERDGDRGVRVRRMRVEGVGAVVPVIAMGVLMALMGD